jgi:RNA polymerase sigma factor (sigma-70 family)|nr:MAG TPA: DNA directed RNA polymerase subunit [Caudoviricetes sp.]
MKENRPNQTDQQATNAALAALAAAGNTFALGQLWEVNKGFLHRLFWQWYSKNKAIADNAGLTLEDFDQEAFFAVQAAAIAYTPEKGAFTTLLYYYVQSQINKAVFGEHRRNITTEDGRRVAVSANPLNDCTSLDAPLDGEDKGSRTKGETIEDPAATQAFQTAEDDLYTEELHNALEDAMTKILTDQEAHVLRRRYYDSQTLRAIGEELGVHCERIRQIERKACRKLSGLSSIQRWHDDVITTRAWRGTGWNAWSRYGSVQERTAEYLEEKEEERFNYYAWRDQMIREHYADLEAAGYFDRHPEWRASLEPRTDSKESTPPGGEV